MGFKGKCAAEGHLLLSTRRMKPSPVHHLINDTLAPFAEQTVAPILSIQGCGSLLSMLENSCNSRTAVYDASIKANCSDGKVSSWYSVRRHVGTHEIAYARCSCAVLHQKPESSMTVVSVALALNRGYDELLLTQDALSSRQRSGRNSAASSPQRSFRMWSAT